MKTILFTTKTILMLFFMWGIFPLQAQQTHEIMWSMSTTSAQATITIDVGDTIKWIWTENGMPHDVSSIDPNAPSGFGSTMMMNAGSEYEFTFTEAVVFNYRCSVHPASMFGTITVESTAIEEVVTIPDANFKSYLIGQNSINTNEDGEIQVSEAIAFAGTINCMGMNIETLTGIEAFIALTNLNCSGNLLTTLDVSENVALVSLDCSDNEIETLNILNNLLLTQIYCQDNMLTSLEVSNNLVLTDLNCSNNHLTDLDMSNNVALTDLYCSNLHITSLDLSNNSALTSLDCSENHMLTSLNVQNGNNINMVLFNALGNEELTCVQVDDANYSTTNWTDIEVTTFFSEDCSASTDDVLAKNSLVIYPNPTQHNLTITSLVEVYSYVIFDVQGKIITEKTFNHYNSNVDIDTHSFENGIYFIKVATTDQRISIFKIIKN